MTLDRILSALAAHGHPARQRRGSWVARCPNHGAGGGDSSPSLHLTEQAGTPLMHCFAGCSSDAVLAVLGLTWKDVLADQASSAAPSRPATRRRRARASADAEEWAIPDAVSPLPLDRMPGAPGKISDASRRWTYRDAAGNPMWVVIRWDMPDGKEVRPLSLWRDKHTGSLAWRLKRPPSPLTLYGLDRLAAQPDAPVLVCEGEKAADAGAAIFPNHAVIAWHGGAAAIRQQDWTPLATRSVTIWPDADAPGLAAAEAVCTALGHGRIVALPSGLPSGWDLADPIPDGIDVHVILRGEAALVAELPLAPDPDVILYRGLLGDVLAGSPRGFAEQVERWCAEADPAIVGDYWPAATVREAWLDTATMPAKLWAKKHLKIKGRR